MFYVYLHAEGDFDVEDTKGNSVYTCKNVFAYTGSQLPEVAK